MSDLPSEFLGEHSADSLLAVRNLSVRFSTSVGAVHAVDTLSFSVSRGQTVGIVGESGSGKSVLARAVMQLVDREAEVTGKVIFDGHRLDTTSASEARSFWGARIAMVFQDPMTSLSPVKKVGAQITDSLRYHLGLSKQQAAQRAIELLDAVGMPEPSRRVGLYPHEMSGGMRQRVAIAIAIACEPQLLLADEPTTALDVTIQRQILDLLADLQRRSGMAMVLISHDLAVVARRTDRTLVMYGGQVVEEGPTQRLFRAPQHPYTCALLAAIPKLDQPRHTRLAVIPGRPADVVDPSPGCRFAARCGRADARCGSEDPPLVKAPDGRSCRCFYPVDDDRPFATLAVVTADAEDLAGPL